MRTKATLLCQVNPDQLSMLQIFLRDNLQNVRGFTGCLSVQIFLNHDSDEMLIDEEWLSVEHHQQYLAFIDNNGVLAQLSAFLMEDPDIRYFSLQDM